MGQRKRYTGEEKVKILREVLEDGKAVSMVAEEYGVHPNLILNWRKRLFEGAPKTFEVRRSDITGKSVERKAQALEEKLREKDEVIAELAREVLALKKTPKAGRRSGDTGVLPGPDGGRVPGIMPADGGLGYSGGKPRDGV
jgi:transposase